eukprot:c19207_g1_i1 orf=387-3377(-)
MEEQQQAMSEGNQTSKSSKNSGGGSRSGGAVAAAVGSPAPSSPQMVVNSKDSVQAGADQNLASAHSLPAVSSRHDAWGVLTAISDKAKLRTQGSQILLYDSEHILGRSVKDPSCQFDSLNVSAKHCTIFRKRFKADESCIPLQGTEPISAERFLVYIKDSSSNGTFINCQKLKRGSPEARIKDGDIISLVNAPEHENAFAFLYQEIKPNAPTALTHLPNGSVISALKRKSLYDGDIALDSNSGDSKRVKGLGIGGPDGPVSLDDVRRLQRSNEELRNQLEAHLLTIEKLRAESRAATARHDAEIKELRETLSAAFLDQIQDLRSELGKKEKELESCTSLCAQQQSQLEDRNRSLAAAIQSRQDADEVIKSQKLNIVELKEQLEDERSQRRSERERAETDLRAAVERARSEATEELKRQSESAAQQLREYLEMINKLQEADRENRSLIETLRSKLDDARETLVKAERTSRALELRLQDEESCSAVARKKIAEKELELQCAAKELQEEKAAKEKALSRLSSVEVEMETAIRDLEVEQQRLQGARERIVLRETQLRAFHSTAEEIAMLQQRQQEQLKEMMRVLEDGEEESNLPTDNQFNGKMAFLNRAEEKTRKGEANDAMQESGRSLDNNTVNNEEQNEDADDADSQTTASNSGIQNQDTIQQCGDGDTQMEEFNGLENPSREAQLVLPADDEQKGSEPSVPMGTDAGYTQLLEIENNCRYMNETQDLGNGREEGAQTKALVGCTQLLDTQNKSLSEKGVIETQLLTTGKDDIVPTGGDQIEGGNTEVKKLGEQNGGPGGETLLLEDENREARMSGGATDGHEQIGPAGNRVSFRELAGDPRNPTNKGRAGPAGTVELLASEVAGSWAYSTPASVHCDNGGWSESQVRVEVSERASNEGQQDSDASQAGSHGMRRRLENSQGSLLAWHDKERRDLNVMLDIVAPEFSRLHGLDRVMETAPDSEDHTEEEEEAEDEGHESDDSAESEPVSQSVSVSARY